MWWIAAATLIFLAWFSYQLLGPNPPILVSKQTTYITAPLRSNGLPDYQTHVRHKLRAGITQENNAAVLMWQAFGPEQGPDDSIPANWELVARELDLPPVDASKCLVDPYSNEITQRVENWLVANHPEWKQAVANPPANQDRDSCPTELGYELVGSAQDAPWRREQLPPLAEWLDANNDAIDLLVEASRRPRHYTPFELSEPGEENTLVSQLPMNGIMRARETARVLGIRAMFHLGEGRHAEAWQDLLATHRWARLVGHGPTIVEQLVAIAIEGIACKPDAVLLASDDLPQDVAQQIQRDLENLPPAADLAKSFDEGERLYFLDSIVNYRNKGIGAFVAENFQFDFETGEPKDPDWTTKLLNLISADWNVGLQEGNRWYDRLAAAASLPKFIDRKREFRQLEMEISGRESSLRKPGNWIVATFSVGKRNEMVATAMIAALSPAFYATLEAQDRTVATLELTQLAAALAVYRAEHGKYPDKLDELVPDVLPQLPVDLYHAKPFIYHRDADGYLLYSTGENGIDDGGSHEQWDILAGRALHFADDPTTEKLRAQIPTAADDLSIRVPRPAFKLPSPPAKR